MCELSILLIEMVSMHTGNGNENSSLLLLIFQKRQVQLEARYLLY